MSPAPPLTTKKVHRSWYIRREVLASAGVLAVAAGVAGVVRMMRPPPDPPVWRASQGVPQGSDPRKLAPGTSGRAPSPADNLTIEPAGTPPPGTMPQAAVKMPAAAPVRVVREAPPSPPAAREENAADRKTPPHPNVRKKVPVATKPQETKPAPDVTPPPAKPPEPEKGPVLIEKL